MVNKILNILDRGRYYRTLSAIIYRMYKLKGKNINNVSFIKDLKVWEFEINHAFYYSTGPGWSYDYDFLFDQFKSNLGFFYLPKEGDVVIDVGAGVGEETIVLSKLVGPTGKVFAIEAHPDTFRALTLNKEKNKLDNVILINKAIADVPGSLFIQNADNSLANKITTDDAGTFKIEATTFDDLFDTYKLEQVNFVKVNIEGAEQLLVKGFNKSISKVLHLAISCHDFRYHLEGDEFFKTKEIVLAFLNKYKYRITLRNTNISLFNDYVYASYAKFSNE